MKDLIPQTQNTNHGSLSNALAEKVTGIPQGTDGRHPLNVFQDAVVVAKMEGAEDGWPMPHVEAPESVCRHFNKGSSWDGFVATGYFTYEGVLVCEEGKASEVKKKLARSTDIMPQVVAEPGAHKPSATK
jgi:hypothetical protein